MIAGIARLDGAPLAACGATGEAALPRMAARFESRAPDGVTILRDEHAGLILGALNVASQSGDNTPVSIDGLSIVFDGRLHNRDDVTRELDAEADVPDPVLALRAYKKWGDAAAHRLIGEFAFAIWDEPQRRLYAARDAAGIRAFLYRQGPGWIAWATEIDILAGGVDSMPPPNEGMAGEYLAGTITSTRETLFQGIFRLPPAHYLTASSAGTLVRRYWTPEPRAELRYRNDAEYEEHLRDLVRTVVSARLRTNRPAGVMLSGGIDSSAVTALSAQACRDGSVTCPAVRAFSISMPGKSDEREYFEAMAAAADVPLHRFTAQLPSPGQFREEIRRDLDVQTFPHAPTSDPLRACARDHGIRVLLTGQGGDDWLGGSMTAYADMLRQGQLVSLARRAWSECAGEDGRSWQHAMKSALWPNLPFAGQQIVRRVLRRGRPPSWIDPAFAARIGLRDRLAPAPPPIPFSRHEDVDTWLEGTSGTMVHAMEATTRSGTRFGLDHSLPFMDRRVVEFGLALPRDQRWRNGRYKDLLRRTMIPAVPAHVANRTWNPNANHVFLQALNAELTDSVPPVPPLAERLGWVRGDEVRALRERAQALYQSGKGYGWPSWAAWIVLAMDLWLDAANVVQ